MSLFVSWFVSINLKWTILKKEWLATKVKFLDWYNVNEKSYLKPSKFTNFIKKTWLGIYVIGCF